MFMTRMSLYWKTAKMLTNNVKLNKTSYVYNFVFFSVMTHMNYVCISTGDTLNQVIPGGARETSSDGGLSVGLQLLQKHAVKFDNDQTIASELRKLQSPRRSLLQTNSGTFPLESHYSRNWASTRMGYMVCVSDAERWVWDSWVENPTEVPHVTNKTACVDFKLQ